MIVAEPIEAYAAAHSTAEPGPLAALAAHTFAETPVPQMMTGLLEGRFLEMLVFALQPQLVLEIGTFTGYGAISMASALPQGGRVITCDVNPDTTAIARRFAEDAGVADRIEFRLGPALDTIGSVDGPFDLVFIDADKTGYRGYYDAVLPKLSPRGLIAVDNVLWSGRVADPPRDDDDPDTRALRDFNDFVAGDDRVVCVMTTIRDGVTLIRRRG
jgi:caffeoyl-CoA O-methyltransferase